MARIPSLLRFSFWPMRWATLRRVALQLRLVYGVVSAVLRGGKQASFNQRDNRPGLNPQSVGGLRGGECGHLDEFLVASADLGHQVAVGVEFGVRNGGVKGKQSALSNFPLALVATADEAIDIEPGNRCFAGELLSGFHRRGLSCALVLLKNSIPWYTVLSRVYYQTREGA